MFAAESQSRTSTSSRDEKSNRVTLGMKDITWGKQEGNVPPLPTQQTKESPSSPPSPILYVPPRPPPPAEGAVASALSLRGPEATNSAEPSSGYGAGVASTKPLSASGVANTQAAPPSDTHATPAPVVAITPTRYHTPSKSSLNPASALGTPNALPSPGQPTPSTLNEPQPITPTSARTSSLGWPNGSANFRISQYNPSVPPISSIQGPRRGSEGVPHVPHHLKAQQPHHRRPSAPFLTVAPPDSSAYRPELEETLQEESPQLPELPQIPLSASSDPGINKGKQPAHKQQMSDPFVVKTAPNPPGTAPLSMKASLDRETQTKRLLEEKIKALVSARDR